MEERRRGQVIGAPCLGGGCRSGRPSFIIGKGGGEKGNHKGKNKEKRKKPGSILPGLPFVEAGDVKRGEKKQGGENIKGEESRGKKGNPTLLEEPNKALGGAESRQGSFGKKKHKEKNWGGQRGGEKV